MSTRQLGRTLRLHVTDVYPDGRTVDEVAYLDLDRISKARRHLGVALRNRHRTLFETVFAPDMIYVQRSGEWYRYGSLQHLSEAFPDTWETIKTWSMGQLGFVLAPRILHGVLASKVAKDLVAETGYVFVQDLDPSAERFLVATRDLVNYVREERGGRPTVENVYLVDVKRLGLTNKRAVVLDEPDGPLGVLMYYPKELAKEYPQIGVLRAMWRQGTYYTGDDLIAQIKEDGPYADLYTTLTLSLQDA
jgi:hypothetical protein